MDIPAYSAQINTTSGSFRNCSERGISPQAFSRNVQDAADLLCTVRFCKTNEDNHLQPTTVPFNNPFDDSRFEKRSIVIVDGHIEKAQPLHSTVSKKRQYYDSPPSYIPANERFSIHSILGSGLSTLQSSSVFENNLHQPVEKSNSAAPEVFPESRLTTATSLNATPLVSGKKDRARSKAKYNASDKGKMTRAKYEASNKAREAVAKYVASEKGKEAKAKYAASERGKEARARAMAKYVASEKGKEARAKYAATERGKEVRARAGAKYAATERGKEVKARGQAKYAATEKGKEARARARAKYNASEKSKMVKAISSARSSAIRSAIRRGFSKEIAREKGELAAQARKLSYQECLRHLSAVNKSYPQILPILE